MQGSNDNFFGEDSLNFLANNKGLKELNEKTIEVILYEHGKVSISGSIINYHNNEALPHAKVIIQFTNMEMDFA